MSMKFKCYDCGGEFLESEECLAGYYQMCEDCYCKLGNALSHDDLVAIVEDCIGTCESPFEIAMSWVQRNTKIYSEDFVRELVNSAVFAEVFDSLAFVCDGCGWIYEIGEDESNIASMRLCRECNEDYEDLESNE